MNGSASAEELIERFEALIRNDKKLPLNTIEPKLYALIDGVERSTNKLSFDECSKIFHACFQKVEIYETNKKKGFIRRKMYSKLQDAAEKRMIALSNQPSPAVAS
jgi:hypothetical protein